ncbi:hypothetical protein DFH11DRAFT_1559917 [Phellopilus nigrolimitatus]|nr:hypothetical protein DFH11DRAFT_1559917 [Phellopilus nigrolimitatus]
MLPVKTPNTAEMLNEIQSETALQLLNSILYQTSPPGSTGLANLDAHLLSSTPHHAAATSSLNRGDIIEIQGPAASGKTQLLYHLTMKCILPHDVALVFPGSAGNCPQKVAIGGWCKGAVIMDTDGRWSVGRLKRLLTRRLEQLLPAALGTFQPSVEELVMDSLQRVHLFRPASSVSLVATLLRLPEYLAERMPSLEIALLAIDSISSFYWADRFNLEQQRQTSADKKDKPSPLSHILIALQEFRLSYGPVTVLTNWGLAPESRNTGSARVGASHLSSAGCALSPFYRQHLHPFPAPFEVPPRVLPNAHLFPPITHHITLPLSAMSTIPAGTASLKEARAMDNKGTAAVNKSETTGIVRTVDGGKTAAFTFYILEDEILG